MNEIRIGLIGGGWMGKAHTTAFHNAKMIFGDDMPVFEIVSDVTEDAAKAFAEQMGLREIYSGLARRCVGSGCRFGGRCDAELYAL